MKLFSLIGAGVVQSFQEPWVVWEVVDCGRVGENLFFFFLVYSKKLTKR